jgi:glycosyltransferase involved in cell wall biosynthesis
VKILLVSQYFWPEFFIINDLVKTLVSQGHEVKVLTGKPNYPRGQLYDGYEHKGTQEELFAENTVIFRVPLRPRKTGGAKNLFLNYWSFIWNGMRFFPAAVKNEHYDAILVFAPSPITMAIPAIYLKWKLKTHLAIWVQDLWPESLSATGFIRNRFLLALVRLLVRGIYSQADTLLVQSEGFIKPVSRNADVEKIIYYPNSYKDKDFGDNQELSQLKDNTLPMNLTNLLDQYFCVTFAGNLGTAQSLETIVDAVAKLKYLPNLRIVLVGSGALSDWLLEQKVNRKLDNLVLAGRLPSEMMSQIFMRSEALLVTLRKDEIFSYTIPSKIQAYLASGRPIIAALDGEGAKVVEKSGAGLTCGAENVDGLVSCIECLCNMTDVEKHKMSELGRNYYLEHFEMDLQAKNLIDILSNRI